MSRRLLALTIAAALHSIAGTAGAATITLFADGDFADDDWFTVGAVTEGGGYDEIRAHNRVAGSGGNPGAHLQLGAQVSATSLLPNAYYVGRVNTAHTYRPVDSGGVRRVTLRYDHKDFLNDGTQHGFLVGQGGAPRLVELGDFDGGDDWTTVEMTFDASQIPDIDWSNEGGTIGFGVYAFLDSTPPSGGSFTDLFGGTSFDNVEVFIEFADEATIAAGQGQSLTTGGGAGFTGGIDLVFENVTVAGTLDVTPRGYSEVNESYYDQGFPSDAFTLCIPLSSSFTDGCWETFAWDVSFDGSFSGEVDLTFNYGDIPAYEPWLQILHYDQSFGTWEVLDGIVDTNANTITVSTNSFSPFALALPNSLFQASSVPAPGSLVLFAGGLAGAWRLAGRRDEYTR